MLFFANPKAGYLARQREIQEAIQRVLSGERYILGPEVEEFESAFARYNEVSHAVGVANGTDAVTLALEACGIGHGDDVITVSHTAVATAAAIRLAGANPVFVDTEPGYYTMDPACLEAAVTSRCKAVVVVHLFGQPAEMDAILPIARRHGLTVIEDCAQAHGARYNGRRVGSIGDAGCFSFYPTKNLAAIGDGGAVVTNRDDVAGRARRLRQYGWDGVAISQETGRNSRLDELQAAILNVQLAHLDADNARRRGIAERYDEALAGLDLGPPTVRAAAEHVFHLYVIATDARDALHRHLQSHDIFSGIHYPVPIHCQPAYQEEMSCPLPVTEGTAAHILSLPIYPALREEDQGRIIDELRSFFCK